MKKKAFRGDTGYFLMLDHIASWAYTTHRQRPMVKVIGTDGSWNYMKVEDWETHIAPHIEVLVETEIGTFHENHTFRPQDLK